MSHQSTVDIFTGMSPVMLQQALAAAQQAYIDLSTGVKGESYSYTQGDGARAVTYTKANLSDLTALIGLLQRKLGLVRRARRPLTFRF